MNIQERYSVARNASNLKMKPSEESNAAPVDVLAAVGMASHANEEAIMLWDITYKGKTSSKMACIEMLSKRLDVQMMRNRWKGDPIRIATQVLSWHLYGACEPCGGRRYQHIKDTPSLSDKLCSSCGGTGKMRLPREDAYAWLQDCIERLISQAGGKVMQKLAIDMDL